MKRLPDDDLKRLVSLSEEATPRPWYFQKRDDGVAMSAYLISTEPLGADSCKFGLYENEIETMIAGTLLQNGLQVAIHDRKWKENTEYIIEAATHLPSIIEELLELRQMLKEKKV